MDLAQFPVRPLGSLYDPLADPYDDPTYSFSYRTSDQSRSENSDANGQVKGLYSYIDDVGDRHSVRYAAGAGTGFEIVNSVPDNPSSVGYTSPLYKAHPKTRGKMSVQRGPDGTYKLIAAGPDHRRAESRASDGVVRGTYSFLDDQGTQRTVEYIAGAGIGYRVLQNLVGPGTHVNPTVTDFRLSDTDFRLANDFGRGAGGPLGGASAATTTSRNAGNRGPTAAGSLGIRRVDGTASESGVHGEGNDLTENDDDMPATGRWTTMPDTRKKVDRMGGSNNPNRGSTRYQGGSSSGGGSQRPDDMYKRRGPERERPGNMKTSNRGVTRPTNNKNTMKTADDTHPRNWERDRERDRDRDRDHDTYGTSGSSILTASGSSGSGVGYNYEGPSASLGHNYNFNDDDVSVLPPLVTPNRKLVEIDRERDWAERHRDSTVIKNVGKWYIGLPPGQTVRAHVQNIDLLPLGGRRVQSPSEALRQDEIADMVASYESETRPKRGN